MSGSNSKKFLLVFTWAFAQATAATPTPSATDVLQRIESVDEYQEVALSPDGRQVAWVKRVPGNTEETPAGSAIFLSASAAASHPTQINTSNATPSQEADLAWSPDSQSLAFLSDARSPEQQQLFVTNNNASVKQLTRIRGNLSTPKWSPDGRQIAILYTPDSERAAGPTAAGSEEVGVAGTHVDEQRLAVINVATGRLSLISPETLYVYDYDWSPDGSRLIVTGAPGEGDNNWYMAQLWIIKAADATATSILQPDYQITAPRWSPDGRNIAFIGGLNSDQGVANGDIYCIPAAGGSVRNLTKNSTASVYWLTWLPDSKNLLFAEAIEGGSGIARIHAAGTDPVSTLWKGPETLTGPAGFARGLSLDRKAQSVAVIRAGFDHSSQVWVGKIGTWRPLTPAVPSQGLWGKADNIRWRSDSFDAQGWLLYPANFDPTRHYPLIVWAHGGPASLTSPHWPSAPLFPDIALAAHGYFVFYPNPRGSAGFGEAYKRANIRDFGGGDLRDILTGVTRVLENYSIDPMRIGIGGWSYGADMTLSALTQTNEFHAAFAGAGTADVLSYYWENDFTAWLAPYFGAPPYDDPQVYAKSSPINFIKNVRTPTLLAVGNRDVESPVLQSREYWNALKALHVKTELVIYPNEGHHFRIPRNARDLTMRILKWYDENLPAPPTDTAGPEPTSRGSKPDRPRSSE